MASIPRLFQDVSLDDGATVHFEGPAVHYLATVLRRQAGDEVLVFNGRDGEWLGRIERLGKQKLELSLLGQTRPQVPTIGPHLLFAPVKKAPIDQIAQKATELGAVSLQPVFTHRTIVTRVREDRLLANAIEAAEQTERLDVPDVYEAVKLETVLDGWMDQNPKRQLLFCDEEAVDGDAPPLIKALSQYGSEKTDWSILIGPEGGFTDAERSRLRALSYVVVASLGPRVLRADTAAFAALTLWQAALGGLA